MNKILVIGSAIVDIIIDLPKLPLTGQDIIAKNEKINIGGCALNVISVLKAFNIDYTPFLPIGTGQYGAILKESLQSMDITSILNLNEGENGHCYTLIEDGGERTFITISGVEGEFKREWFQKVEGESYTHAYISGYSLLGDSGENIINYLELHPYIKVVFAPGPRIDTITPELLSRILKLFPIIHINHEEIKFLSAHLELEKQLIDIYNKTNELVIVSLGEKGAMYIIDNTITTVPCEKVNIVNTSGAGDAHIGAIITGILKDMPIEDSIAFANKISARVISQKDTKYKE